MGQRTSDPSSAEERQLRTARFDFHCARMIAALRFEVWVRRSKVRESGKAEIPVQEVLAYVLKRAEEMRIYAAVLDEFTMWHDFRKKGEVAGAERDAAIASSKRILYSEYDHFGYLEKRAQSLALRFPAPEDWKDFILVSVVPAINDLDSTLRRCPDCGREFVATRKDRAYCSDKCSSRKRGRGRSKPTGGRSAAVHAQKEAEDELIAKIRRHFQR